MGTASSYLSIIRPANVVTSVADVLAGSAITGAFIMGISNSRLVELILLCCSTACLYAGGIVFNDVFDADLDKLERPERAIPSGLISLKQATLFGGLLLMCGIVLAGFVSLLSMLIATMIASAALLYDKIGKHNTFLGPLNMGICRGLNLLLGSSIIPAALQDYYILAAVPVIYIYAVTMISRGEIHGGNRSNLYIAAALYALVACSMLIFSYLNNKLLITTIIMIPFLWMIFKPLLKAMKSPVGRNIGAAVKAGVISLILMDAGWAATFGNLYIAFLVACLLPVSTSLAKKFAVT